MQSPAFGFTSSRFDALIEEFAESLKRDPAFSPAPQKGRVRCDRCGAYHPGVECARCRDFLEDAKTILRQQEHVQQLALMRARHAQRRADTGYALHHTLNRVRRTLRRWARALHTPSNLLHLGLAVLLTFSWIAFGEARSSLFWLAVGYACIGRALIAWHAHLQLCRLRPYECWHRVGVRGKPLSSWVHWGAFAGVFGLTTWQVSRAIAAIPTPQPSAVPMPHLATFWTSATEWNTWTLHGATGDARQSALMLHSTTGPHVASYFDLSAYGGSSGWGSRRLALTPDGAHLYTTWSDASMVLEFNTHTNEIERWLQVDAGPRGLAVAPDGSCLLITHPPTNTLTVLNLRDTHAAPTRIAVGQRPISVVFSPDSSRAYVCYRDETTISEISLSLGRIVASLDVGSTAREADISARHNVMMVADWAGSSVLRFDIGDDKQKARFSVAGSPWNIAVAPDGTFALVSNANDSKVLRIDLNHNRVIRTFTLSLIPEDIKIAPDGSYAYITSANSLLCMRPDTGETIATIPLQGQVQEQRRGPEIAIGHDGSYAYVASGSGISRIEGRPPVYDTYGVATTSFDLRAKQPAMKDVATSHFSLRKKADLRGGTLTYYVASGETSLTPSLPIGSHVTDAEAWRAKGWMRLQWHGDMASLPAGLSRYCHLAVAMTTRDTRVSPLLKSLTLDND